MQTKENQRMRILQYILGIMMVCSILYFVIGEICMPQERLPFESECVTFNDGWERIFPDGRKEKVTVPGECDVKQGDTLVIQKELPNIQEDTSICIRSSQQDIKIYVGDELRENYTTKNTRPFGKNSVSVYVFGEMTSADAGKIVRMEIVSESPYSGYINDIFIGDKSEIWKYFLKLYMPGTFVALLMMLLSIAVLCYSGIIRYMYKKKMDISYLGCGLLIGSLWLIAESRLRQLLLPNSTVASDVGFFMIMLLPYPFLSYINSIQKRRYQKAFMAIALFTVVNFIVTTVLQVANIKDFSETMGMAHVIIIMVIALLFITVGLDIRKGYIKDYPDVAVGLAVFMLAGIYEIYLVYDKSSLYNGIVLCLGLVFLLFTAGLKTGRDMLRMEKEKQMAIVAGESKAKFLANMSHEIRTPINTVIGMNEMILRESSNENIREYATNIQHASRMLLGLINDVLDFSKIEAGKLEIIENPYELSALLNDVILGIRVRAQNKKLEVSLEIDEDMPSVLNGDEIRVKQILNNLLSNAVKYTEQGSITFCAKGVEDENGFALQIAVKDTGIGIRKEDLVRLYDSFQRLELKKNRYIEGTGLGLSITKQLIDQMKGTIHVESEYGKGTCFTVQIPQQIVDKTAMGALENSHVIERNGADKEKQELYAPEALVLVVDDNDMNLAVIEGLLKQTGIQLEFAGGGKECLSMCQKKMYDLILMDHMMPDPDGVKTLHLLRNNADSMNQHTPVIVLTANAIAGAKEQYLKEGFADYLSKPIEYDKLEQLLASYLKCTSKSVRINRGAGLQYCSGNEDLYKQVLELYCKQGKQYVEELSGYYEERNWKQYAIVAHTIKSTSLTIGAELFSQRAKQQELAAKEENEKFLFAEWETFIAEYISLIEEVEQDLK